MPYCTPKNQMTKEQANELFTYHDGLLYWSKAPRKTFPKHLLDEPIGIRDNERYACVKYKGKAYKVHNIIWNMHNGIIPSGYTVDHINRDTHNNRLDNLRLATSREQTLNKSMISSTGHINIHMAHGKYCVQVKHKHVGLYSSIGDAIKARDNKIKELDNGGKATRGNTRSCQVCQ